MNTVLNHPARRIARLLLICCTVLTAGSLVFGQVGTTTPQPTIITSEFAQVQNNGVESYGMFRESVRVTGTNLEMTCDLLEVFGEEMPDEAGTVGRIGPMRTRRLVATGNVVIKQAGREAKAAVVEVLPLEDVVILTGEPVIVTDTHGTYRGSEMRFHRGEQRIEITKPSMTVPSLPNLGFPQRGGDDTANGGDTEEANPAPANP